VDDSWRNQLLIATASGAPFAWQSRICLLAVIWIAVLETSGVMTDETYTVLPYYKNQGCGSVPTTFGGTVGADPL
jgi:hypothetical protein